MAITRNKKQEVKVFLKSYHDKVNELIKEEMAKAQKTVLANHFLSALSNFSFLRYKLKKPSRDLEFTIRSNCTLMTGLGVYARYMNSPDSHIIKIDDNEQTICSVCTHRFEHKNPDYNQMTEGQKHRMQYGFHSQIDALDNFHIIKYFNVLPINKPSEKDISWFKEILTVLDSMPKESTIKDALTCMKDTAAFHVRIDTMKKIAKENSLATSRLTANTELFFERFLETLGFCSILDSEKHHGYYTGKVIAFPPRTNWVSDWYYPADFWKGDFGINKEALQYWFGNLL